MININDCEFKSLCNPRFKSIEERIGKIELTMSNYDVDQKKRIKYEAETSSDIKYIKKSVEDLSEQFKVKNKEEVNTYKDYKKAIIIGIITMTLSGIIGAIIATVIK